MEYHRKSFHERIFILAFFLSSCGGSSTSPVTEPPVKSWSGPTLIESQDGIAGGAKAAIDSDGLGIVVWSLSAAADPRNRRIYATRELSNGEWTEPLVIDDGDGNPFSPLLALQPNGDAVVVWTEDDGNFGQHVYANTFDTQAGWAGPLRLSAYEHQEDPFLASNDKGDTVVVWRASDIFGRSIVAKIFNPQTGWGASEIINPVLTSSSQPQATVDDDGNAVAVWNDNLIQDTIYTSQYSVGSGWEGTDALYDSSGGVSLHAVGIDSAGDSVVIWSQFEGSAFYRLLSRQHSPVSGWSEPETIGFDDGRAGIHHVEADDQRGLVAIGSHATGFEMADIFVLHRAPVGTWSDPIVLDTEDGFARFPEVALAPDGRAIATWRQFDGEENSAYSAVFTPESGWAAPQLLETINSNDPQEFDIGSVNISMNANGDAIATWSQYDGSGYSTYINRYE